MDVETAGFTFTQRLARENAWAEVYARRVVFEYKRFLFLAVAAGHPVTPSDQVDQVWHLHLTYSRSYWQDLCGHVLGKPLHHNPTQGGEAEARKYLDQYQATLRSYEACFGEPAPADIWPPANVRFGDDLYFQRINARRYWVVKKPGLPDWLKNGGRNFFSA